MSEGEIVTYSCCQVKNEAMKTLKGKIRKLEQDRNPGYEASSIFFLQGERNHSGAKREGESLIQAVMTSGCGRPRADDSYLPNIWLG